MREHLLYSFTRPREEERSTTPRRGAVGICCAQITLLLIIP